MNNESPPPLVPFSKDPVEDKFDKFNNAVSIVAGFIQQRLSQISTGSIIGIYGSWGSGKTFFAHKVAHTLSNCQLIWFHPTAYKDEGEVAAAFFESALKQIQVDPTGFKRMKIKAQIQWHNQNLPGGLDDLWKQILMIVLRLTVFIGGPVLILSLLSSGNLSDLGATVGALLGGTAIIVEQIQKALEPGLNFDSSKFVRRIQARTGDNALEQYVKEFQWIAGLAISNHNPLVVMVDQIDDGLPTQTALILESLRLFGTGRVPCAFVIIADKIAVRTAVQIRFLNQVPNDVSETLQASLIQMADDYLDRIIPFSVELPLPPLAWQQERQEARRLIVPPYDTT
jgi:hypothetical protein